MGLDKYTVYLFQNSLLKILKKYMVQEKQISFQLINKFLYETIFYIKVHAIRENNRFSTTT